MITTTRWTGKHAFETDNNGAKAMLDGSVEAGPSPKALLLSGLAGCSGIDVVDILEKMRVTFKSLEITAEAEQTEEHPKVFKDIQLTYILDADPADEDKIKKAVDLSLDKYCGVAAMLRKNSPIHYKIVIK